LNFLNFIYWSEYDVAENAAFNTNGVWAVVNQLNVRDYRTIFINDHRCAIDPNQSDANA